MKIAICDDDKIFREMLINIIEKYRKEMKIPATFLEFSSGQELLDCAENSDLIFLDYRMDGIDGLETAKILRQKNIMSKIIYITNFPDEFIYESFKVEPFRFFKKPVSENEIVSALNDYFEQQKLLYPIIINTPNEQIKINTKKIVYIEGNGKNSTIRTTDNVFHSSKTLSQIQELLPKHCFFRVHKSYIVNFYYIDSFGSTCINLTNGEKAQISRNAYTKFKEEYKAFIKNYLL